jgi:hypothetical protein
MDDITLTEEGYSILRRVVNGKKANKLLIVTFDLETNPIAEFDLHSSESDVLVNQGLAEYVDSVSVPNRINWDDIVIFPDPYVSAKITPTNLGEFALEQYDKNERRFRNSEIRSWIAIIVSVSALFISIFL